MTLLWLIIGLIVFDIAALLWGYDSRDMQGGGLTSEWKLPRFKRRK